MKNEITICLDQANKIKYERLNEFEGSVFQDVYENAFRKVESIIKDNPWRERGVCGKEGSDEQVYNVISFLGQRGVGKTSAMLSFVRTLENGFCETICGVEQMQNLSSFSGLSNLSHIQQASFSVLEYIDATLLEEKEGILDVILARMWDKYEAICRNARKERKQEILEADLKDQFESVRSSYLLQKSIVKGKLDESKEISTLRTLHKLAVSINLRDGFKKLVSLYLDFIHSSDYITKKKNFLVISIDDIDMASGNVYKYLEQIRRFLTVPQVIIFITADIQRLQMICRKHEEIDEECKSLLKEGYRKIWENGNDFVDDYLSKSLPHNSRIYMPDLKEENGLNSTLYKLPDKFNAIKSGANGCNQDLLKTKEEKILILEYMARYLHLYFDVKRGKRHFLQNSTMRDLINYFQSINDIIEYNMESLKENTEEEKRENARKRKKKLDWFRRDLHYRLMERLLTKCQRKEFQQLFYLEPEDINEELIRYIHQNLSVLDEAAAKKYYRQYKKYKADYGLVLRGLYLIERKGVKYRSFVDFIIAFYTLIIAERKSGIYQESLSLPGGMIQGGWRNNKIFFGIDKEKEIYFSNKNAIKLAISSEKNIRIENEKKISPDEIRNFVMEVIKNNKESIFVFQMLMLMYKNVNSGEFLVNLPLEVTMDLEYTNNCLKEKESQEIGEQEKILWVDKENEDLLRENEEELNKKDVNEAFDAISSRMSNTQYGVVKIGDIRVTIVSSSLQHYKFGLLNFAESINMQFGKKADGKEDGRGGWTQWIKRLKEAIYTKIVEELKAKNLYVEDEAEMKTMNNPTAENDGQGMAFAQQDMEKDFLYVKMMEWKGKFPNQAVLPFENVEFMYELDKKLNQCRMPDENRDFYQFAKSYYILMEKELGDEERYYKDDLGITINYKECFLECPYIKYFYADKTISEESKNKFVKAFEEIFTDIETSYKGTKENDPIL